MDKMNLNGIIALLPIKEHSQRVPNKNIRNFCGKPLYHRVLESLLKSPYINKVVIDTDSEFIARDATENFDRVRILMRPKSLCGDFVSMNDIINYDISQEDGEYFLQTHSTNPLLATKSINLAIESFFGSLGRCDSLFSVTRLQTRLYWEDGRPINHNPDELIRTQDLPPVFEENSNIFIFSKTSFINSGRKRIGKKPLLYEIEKLESIDIDEEADFKIAEVIYDLYHR